MTGRAGSGRRRATISDVAQAAGVSRTTVSLVLADHRRIPESTKQRVRQAMAELGYVYNRAATAVRSGHSSLVGLVVTDVRNPFFAELAMAVERAVEAGRDSSILGFAFSDGDPQREARIALSLIEHLVSGMILLPTPAATVDSLACLRAIALVQLLREVPGLESDFVGVDNLASGRLLGGHLQEVGARRVLFVGGERGSAQFRQRREGVAEALAGEVRSVLGGADGVVETLRGWRPDAVVTYSDTHLLSVARALRERGLEPGREVALASFDNTHLSAELSPAVTSVDHHVVALAEHAVALLRERESRPEGPARRVTIPGELVVRESTLTG